MRARTRAGPELVGLALLAQATSRDVARTARYVLLTAMYFSRSLVCNVIDLTLDLTLDSTLDAAAKGPQGPVTAWL